MYKFCLRLIVVNDKKYVRDEHLRRNILKKKKQKKIRNRLITLQSIIFLLIASLFFTLMFVPGNDSLIKIDSSHPDTLEAEALMPVSNVVDHSAYIQEIDSNGISSSNAILLFLSSGEVLAQKGPDEKIYPASMTKILTTVVAIEHFEDLEVSIEVPSDIFPYLRDQNASCAGFQAGEKVKIIDLLYGVMLPSGADACLTIARAVSGNEQNFAKKMTEKAHEIGAKSTNFTNSTGLHDDNHYSTVRDMAKILMYALKNDTFRTVFTTEEYTTHSTAKHPYGITLNSTTFSAFRRAGITNKYVKGGKTGFTGEAKLCLASLAEKNGKEYILITCGAGTPTSYSGVRHAVDAQYIYDNYLNFN